ncbi:hypothetical protein M3223_10330 [Paenibacillus pasadenensis]|uniref:hypothetical protein n=1 Tax=Paenibacillus pasadenensis TaxID=217090 RepID=UPI00203AEF1E|nr:hypothetical protein [Paenibacillus pasadenensis]MCM3747753.1 hypothetical protein [Paenibacillus pasadenensis]
MGLGGTRQTNRAAPSESESAGAENDRNAVPGRYNTSDLANLRHPERFLRAASYMAELPDKPLYSREELLVPELLLERSGPLEMYYAPHNELAGGAARIVVAGLTPGWRQMEISLRVMRRCLVSGGTPLEACREAKRQARFAGSMRTGLLDMLEKLGLREQLGRVMPWPDEAYDEGLSGPADLLDHPMLHTTSVLPCPVFRNGANYSGHQPPLRRDSWLWNISLNHMRDELGHMASSPLLVPLGKAVEEVVQQLVHDGELTDEQVLWGFPHPSGANGHRHRQFEQAFPELKRRLKSFTGSVESN